MDAVEDYARRWIKREVDQDPESLSDWVRTIRFLVQGRIRKLKNSIHNYLEIMFPIDVLRFPEFRTMRNHLSETLMLNDIQITSDYNQSGL
jgi:hypothetical protein